MKGMQTRCATVTVSPMRSGGSMAALLLALSTAAPNTTSTSSIVSSSSITNPPAGVVLALMEFTPRLHFFREAKSSIAAPGHWSDFNHDNVDNFEKLTCDGTDTLSNDIH